MATLAPDVVGHDAGEFQFVPPILGIAHYTGYPLYTLLGWLWTLALPLGTPAYRMNLLSAACAALGVAWAMLLARRLGAGPLGSALGAITLAVSPLYWTWGTIAGVRALTALFAVALPWLALRWWERPAVRGRLLWLAAGFGLALTHHRSLALLGPSLALLVVWRRPGLLREGSTLALAAVAGLAPLTLYLYLPIRAAMGPPFDQFHPDTWRGFSNLVLAGPDSAAHFTVPASALPARLALLAADASQQFGWAGLLLGSLGLALQVARAPRRGLPVALFIVAIVILTLLWDVGPDHLNTVYLLPAYALWGPFVACGVSAAVSDGWRTMYLVRSSHATRHPPLVIAALLTLALTFVWWQGWEEQQRRWGESLAMDRFRLALDTGWAPRRLAASSLPHLEPDAIVVAEWDQATVFWYLQLVEGVNPTVTVSYPSATLEAVAQGYPGRPLYAAAAFPQLAGKRLTAVGALARVLPAPDVDGHPPRTPLALRFAGGPQLLGLSYWDASGRPLAGLDSRQPVLAVTLEWRAEAPISEDLSVSLRLIDETGRVAHQVDNRHPVLGLYPTSRWVVGERVSDYYELALADLPHGRYRLALLVYAPIPGGFRNLTAYQGDASLGEAPVLAEITR